MVAWPVQVSIRDQDAEFASSYGNGFASSYENAGLASSYENAGFASSYEQAAPLDADT